MNLLVNFLFFLSLVLYFSDNYPNELVPALIPGVSASDNNTGANYNSCAFDCFGKLEGYYADMRNGCKTFHICGTNYIITMKCPEGYLFDQRYHSCSSSADVLECQLSGLHYKDAALPMLSPAPHFTNHWTKQLSEFELQMLETPFHGSYTNLLVQNNHFNL